VKKNEDLQGFMGFGVGFFNTILIQGVLFPDKIKNAGHGAGIKSVKYDSDRLVKRQFLVPGILLTRQLIPAEPL